MNGTAVEYRPPSVPLLRRRLVTELTLRGLPDDAVTDAALVLSELVGNALRHGRPLRGGGLRAYWEIEEGVLSVEVTDGGRSADEVTPRRAVADATGGRGLAIVEALSREWGVRTGPLGTTVWAKLELSAPASREGQLTGG